MWFSLKLTTAAFAEAGALGLANQNKLGEAALPDPTGCTCRGRDTRDFNKRPDGQMRRMG